MFNKGLVSISFRNHSVDEIINEALSCDLSGIEWGSDIHVPAGDEENAIEVSKKMDKANLKTYSYGSYYRVGENNNPENDFISYLKCADALKAPVIRVWAGSKGTKEVDLDYVNKVIDDSRIICDMAKKYNITICFEYHNNTLTDNSKSAVDIYKKIDRKNLMLYWQPDYAKSHEENLNALKDVLPYLNNVHVFYWSSDKKRLSLSDGVNVWNDYLNIIKSDKKHHNFLLEFVTDDNIKLLKQEANILGKILEV